MKKFILRILRYSLIILTLLLCLEFFVFPKNKNPYSIKYNLIKDYNLEMIIGGNSHLGFGVLADSLTFSAANMANKGREFETDVAIINNLEFEKYKNLKAVIIPISYYSLFSSLNDIENKYLVDQKRLYYHFYNIKNYDQGIITNRLLFNSPARELFNDSFLFPFLNKNIFSPKGWRANDITFQNDNEIYNKLKKVDLKLADKITLNKNLALLKSLINKCKENNVKLYLILPPYSNVYYSVSKNKYTNLILKIMQKKFNSEDFFLINSNTFMTSSLEYYENTDHLNFKGAHIFTEKLDSIFNKTLR